MKKEMIILVYYRPSICKKREEKNTIIFQNKKRIHNIRIGSKI